VIILVLPLKDFHASTCSPLPQTRYTDILLHR
jgi:hypothetical protein